jgi:PAS domain-containing protein
MESVVTHEPPAVAARAGSDLPFRRLLDVIPAGAYTTDAAGLITAFNRRAVDLWGREPSLNDPVDRY